MSSPRASPRAASPSKDRKNSGSQSPKAAAPAATAPWMAWAKSHVSVVTYLALFGVNSIAFFFAPHLWYPTSADVTLWMQFAGVVHLTCFLKQCPGSMGYFMTACVHLATMAKFQFVDKVTPPTYMIALGIVSFGLATYSHFFNKATKFGLNSFMFANTALFVMFCFFPSTALANNGGEAVKLGCVIGSVALANVLSSCPGNMGRTMAMTVYVLQICYDYFVAKSVVPVPVIALAIVAFAANVHAYALGKQAKKQTVSSPKVKST